jgi:hypothetical protein
MDDGVGYDTSQALNRCADELEAERAQPATAYDPCLIDTDPERGQTCLEADGDRAMWCRSCLVNAGKIAALVALVRRIEEVGVRPGTDLAEAVAGAHAALAASETSEPPCYPCAGRGFVAVWDSERRGDWHTETCRLCRGADVPAPAPVGEPPTTRPSYAHDEPELDAVTRRLGEELRAGEPQPSADVNTMNDARRLDALLREIETAATNARHLIEAPPAAPRVDVATTIAKLALVPVDTKDPQAAYINGFNAAIEEVVDILRRLQPPPEGASPS